MVNAINLSEFDRAVFELAADAGFLNPFSLRYREIVRKLAGAFPQKQENLSQKELLGLVIKRCDDIIQNLERHGVWPAPIKIGYFEDKSLALVQHVFLLRELYRYADDFDELIVKQVRRPEKNFPASFVANMVYGMGVRGISKADALRSAAIFYQMRRTHYFMSQGLIGQSECMRKLREDLWNCLFTEDARFYEKHLCGRAEDFAVLFCGPVGCGKGMAAAILGRCGFIPFDEERGEFKENFMGLFLPVNLGRWHPEMVESELFGCEAGAVSGMAQSKSGVLGQCRPWGTVFLDEIGELSGPMQVRLLHMLDERSYVPVGGVTARNFSGRAAAATSRPMAQLLRQGAFREDLYYRLSAGCVTVPSLALRVGQNADELRELVEHIVRRMTEGEHVKIAERVMRVLGKRRDYGWPGNVRELERCVRRVMLTGGCGADDDPSTHSFYSGQAGSGQAVVERIAAGIEHERLTAEELTAEYCRFLMGRHKAYTDVAKITGLNWRTVRGMTASVSMDHV